MIKLVALRVTSGGKTAGCRNVYLARILRAIRSGRKAWLIGLLATATIAFWSTADATAIIEPLAFAAGSQSIWGPSSGSAGFDYSGSASTSLLGLSLTVGYDLGASTGTVSGHFNGSMLANYTTSLSSPGLTSVGLSFGSDPTGGLLSSQLGYVAQLCAILCAGPNLYLDIGKQYATHIDQSVSDTVTQNNVVQVPVVDLIAASAGAEMGVSETDTFLATGLTGSLVYSLRGSGVSHYAPFDLAADGGQSLSVNLNAPGIWDFGFQGQTLANQFSTSLNMNLGVYAQTAAGCGTFHLEQCTATDTLLSPTVYSTPDPFGLAFNSISQRNAFSIEVGATTVPEPATIALVGVGLLGLGFSRRRKRA